MVMIYPDLLNVFPLYIVNYSYDDYNLFYMVEWLVFQI